MSAHSSILLVRFSSLGDLLLTTPLLRALRERHPAAHIAMVTREDMAETIQHNPRLNQVITWQYRSPMEPLVAQLREREWTDRLDLHGSLRSCRLRHALGGTWSGYPKHRLRRSLLIKSRRRFGGPLGHVVQRYFAAAKNLDVRPDPGPLEFFTTSEAEQRVEEWLRQHQLGIRRPLVALAPGAAHFTKRWPPDYWLALVRRLRQRYDLAILGGKAEREVAAAMADQAGDAAASAAGDFTLSESAALLKRARTLMSGDTGVMHLATAVATPVVVLFGPTVEEFGFFPWQARATILQRETLYCRPCSAHGGPVCPEGHHRCLREITPEMAAEAIIRTYR